MEYFTHKLAASAKKVKADVVIKNGKIIDVFNGEIIEEDIAITDGVIVGIGHYEGIQTIDAKGKYISPGFIDGHVHIESAMVTPQQFSQVVIPHGVTTVIADPHEIANVSGSKGIQFMIDSAKDIPLNTYFMLPSCVPATPFENAGAVLTADDLEIFYKEERVLGLAEVMDFPSVFHQEKGMMKKLITANKLGKKIDGHAAGLSGDAINVYASAGIKTDHECVTPEEAHDRLKRGMYVMLREGSAARDVSALLPVITERNSRRCLFVTDDKHLDDLVAEGSIDYNIFLSIKGGLNPILAYQMATINAAECFGLTSKGAIAPGYDADLVFIDSLEDVKIEKVFLKGKLMAENGRFVCSEFSETTPSIPDTLSNTIHIQDIEIDDLQIPCLPGTTANIIEIIPNKIITKHIVEEIHSQNGYFQPSVSRDHLKMTVVERHAATGNIGLGIVKGFGLKSGAIASTVAHDSHNIIALGTNDQDLLKAIYELKAMGGGLVVMNENMVIASLPLEISGLMTASSFKDVNKMLKEIDEALLHIGFTGNFNPFLTLSFLALPVIPELKLTDLGLFQVKDFKHVDVVNLR
ncbi:adenine deaminase [Metabacillus litoralis]|uniref:adenine deaminase n=1 Tax=Metabacillus litoralis TaxID=152268 RepID=UPI00203FFFBD|nr:adenine deaminase [Metabacillus litoralis]MCM3411685.1 adenine deaminase [Metabacillus litoralis]